MVARHTLNVELLVRIQTPQPFRIDLLICFAVKGGGEVKKKQRCLLKRFAALVAAVSLSCSLMLPFASAASDSAVVMPSRSDFESRQGSWFVWRVIDSCYELLCSPVIVSGSSYTLPFYISYSTSPFEVSYIANNSGTRYYYACSYPVPLRGASGNWSDLPSFDVGAFRTSASSRVRVYSTSAQGSSVYGYLVPVVSASDHLLSFGNSSGSSTDSFDFFTFYSPFYSYPFAFRSVTSSSGTSYGLVGGDNSFIVPPDNVNSSRSLLLSSSYFLSGPSSFRPFPNGFTVPSSNLGIVLVSKPSSDGLITYPSEFSTSAGLAFSLLVPVSQLPDINVGDWISQGTMDKLQDQLVNDFDVNSDTLKNSKDNLNSWNSTSSVDSDVASGATGLLNGIFQNLGAFLFSVSLLCFGAVVLRMLIRKAVDG